MLELAGQKIYFGDFHGQWNEDRENPSILLAGYSYYGYDFTVFQGPGDSGAVQTMVKNLGMPFKVFPGRELMFNFNHITTWSFAGTPPVIDEPDIKKVLRDLRKRSKFIIAAHPYPSFIKSLGDLLKEGLLDAVEIVNTADWNEPLINWYYSETSKGNRIPIVSGLDIHVSRGFQRPDILYTPDYPGADDIQQLGVQRTLVFCNHCTEEEIIKSVANCQTLVEFKDQLLGPKSLIKKIEDAGYWEKRREQQKKREALRLELCPGSYLTAGMPVKLRVGADAGGRATFLSQNNSAIRVNWQSNKMLNIKKFPHLFDRNQYFAPLAVYPSKGISRTFALKTRSPLEINLLPEIVSSGGRANCYVYADLKNDTDKTLNLSCKLSGRALEKPVITELQIKPHLSRQLSSPVKPFRNMARPARFTLAVKSADMKRIYSANLVFVTCNYSENAKEEDWARASKIFLGYKDQIDPCWTSHWNGPEDIRGEVSLLWNKQGLYLRTKVVDDVLCTRSPDTDIVTFGDSIQIGINPINREDVPAMSFYNITLTRGAERVPEARIETVPQLAVHGLRSPKYKLPASCYAIRKLDKTKTLCSLFLPWSILMPMQPIVGYRFELFLLLWDNDGAGIKTSLQWPSYMEKETGHAWYVPQAGTWGQIKLGG